ncbi:endonuclease/exonuclease/phosphatase family protein [Hyalangium gracile]|uniref:endonuclease/exonuclease/phosphatase family protein n=1 Tax=Hyalangium gracile TaxID=394092 RepID=UPI001CCB2E54|nr:endonuclease/exonuclease/phosphatase family protein [Hyalangium gracile]
MQQSTARKSSVPMPSTASARLRATAFFFALLCLLPASAWAVDAWIPDHGHASFFRNNSTSDFTIQAISQIASTSGCTTSGTDYHYTSGTANVAVSAGDMVEVLNVDDTANCLKSGDKWRFMLARNGCATTHEIQISGDGSLSANGGAFSSTGVDKLLSFCGVPVVVNLFGRDSYKESGVYVTIGTNSFSERGPTRDASNIHTLTVTSYNTFLGTGSKPERCDRSESLATVLEQLDTDVLVLQEMNLREADCFDGLELAAYLWTGNRTSTGDDHIENDSYANSKSGTGSSPNGDSKYAGANGAFPYISQFVSGIAVNGNEEETGGVVILSKYPLTMIENRTYAERNSDEEKGFIAVKVTKSSGGASQDYYLVATHTSSNISVCKEQLAEMASYLNTTSEIPDGARVILAGDLNSNGKTGEFTGLGVNVQYTGTFPLESYGHQTGTQYYPYSRDSRLDFYHNNGSMETIDWVQPMSAPTTGHDYADPASFSWYVFPIRDTGFKFADLSDHFAVTGQFTY